MSSLYINTFCFSLVHKLNFLTNECWFSPCRWKDFYRSMFWLGIFAGSLIFLHAFFLFIMKCRKKIYDTQGSYGALTFPRFEIFVTFVALPSMSMASGALFRGNF